MRRTSSGVSVAATTSGTCATTHSKASSMSKTGGGGSAASRPASRITNHAAIAHAMPTTRSPVTSAMPRRRYLSGIGPPWSCSPPKKRTPCCTRTTLSVNGPPAPSFGGGVPAATTPATMRSRSPGHQRACRRDRVLVDDLAPAVGDGRRRSRPVRNRRPGQWRVPSHGRAATLVHDIDRQPERIEMLEHVVGLLRRTRSPARYASSGKARQDEPGKSEPALGDTFAESGREGREIEPQRHRCVVLDRNQASGGVRGAEPESARDGQRSARLPRSLVEVLEPARREEKAVVVAVPERESRRRPGRARCTRSATPSSPSRSTTCASTPSVARTRDRARTGGGSRIEPRRAAPTSTITPTARFHRLASSTHVVPMAAAITRVRVIDFTSKARRIG